MRKVSLLSLFASVLVSLSLGCAGGGGSSSAAAKPPTAAAGTSYAGHTAVALTFNSTGSSDPQGQSLSYAWNFGDNSTGSGASPTHAYAAAGTYTVTLTVTNTSNLSSSATATATITNQPPVAFISGPYQAKPGVAVGLSAASTRDPQGSTLSYSWTFGDNATGTGVTPTHTYAANGTYNVSMTATDALGLSATATTTVTVANLGIPQTGVVKSGTTAVAGAHVYLLSAGTAGYGTASTSLLSATATGASDTTGAYVTTASDGTFTLPGGYACTSAQQMYLLATGGSNAAASFLSALGDCSQLGNTSALTVNEVTTIAAAYSLAGFMTATTKLASSGTALALTGVANAFLAAPNLADPVAGAAVATPPGSSLSTSPRGTVATLANILAACNGTSSATSTNCTTLFTNTPAGSVTPTDTATAAINLAHNPGVNISALYALQTSTSPFPNALTKVPGDFTLSIAFTQQYPRGGWGLAVDAAGNVWTYNNQSGNVEKYAPNGNFLSPLSTRGFVTACAGSIANDTGVSIDTAGNAWMAGQNGICKLSPTGTLLSPSTGYTGGGYNGTARGTAFDPSGNLWVTQLNSSLAEFSSTGTALSPSTGFTGGGLNQPWGIAITPTGSVWVTNSSVTNDYLSGFTNAGVALSSYGFTGGGIGWSWGDAVDHDGNIWVADVYAGVTKLTASGTLISTGVNGFTGGGIGPGIFHYPSGVAIDGNGNAFVAYGQGSSNLAVFTTAGVPLSPSNGYTGVGLSPNYNKAIALDGSGNVWMSDDSGYSITEIIGLATPVVTPLSVGVKNNALGTRP